MDEFTFITITYNHEKYIRNHLNSIKRLVKKYGEGVRVQLIIADDCSSDNTIGVVKDWLDKNPIFYNTIIAGRTENAGTVQNILDAIDRAETKQFKVLAGDDLYMDFNIFRLYDELNGRIAVAKVKAFGVKNKKILYGLYKNFKLARLMNERNKLGKLLKIGNFLPAPAVFVPGEYLKAAGLRSFLKDYRYIEDYPMWIYFIIKNKISVYFIDEYYIYYRTGSGVSTVKSSFQQILDDELDRIYRDNDIKWGKYPKIINPYVIWSVLVKLFL